VFVKLQACPESLRWYLVASLPVYIIVVVVALVDWVRVSKLVVHRADRSLRTKLQTSFGLLVAASLSRCTNLLVGLVWPRLLAAAYFAVFCFSQLCMYWLFTAVVLTWAYIYNSPLNLADETKQHKVLALVNALLMTVVVVLAVLVSAAGEKEDRERYVQAANITMGLFSLVLGFLLAFYGYKVGQLRNTSKNLKDKHGVTSAGHGKSTSRNRDVSQSLLLGVLFSGQAACWAVSDPEGDHLAAVVVVSHLLSSAALVLLFSIYHRSKVSLSGRSSRYKRHSTAPVVAAADKTRSVRTMTHQTKSHRSTAKLQIGKSRPSDGCNSPNSGAAAGPSLELPSLPQTLSPQP
jgi:hypothetical protein